MPADTADHSLIAGLEDKESYARATAALLLATNMTGESFKALSEFKGLNDLPEQYRKEIDHSLKDDPYRPPKTPPKFTREQVLEYIRALPNPPEEMATAFTNQSASEEQHPGIRHHPKPPKPQVTNEPTPHIQPPIPQTHPS